MQHEIRASEERLWAAMLGNDVGVLEELVHDRLLFVGPNGALVRKEDDLALHRTRVQRMTRLDVVELLVESYGAFAVAVVHAEVAGSMDGQAFGGAVRWVRTWLHTDAGWRIVAGAACPVQGG